VVVVVVVVVEMFKPVARDSAVGSLEYQTSYPVMGEPPVAEGGERVMRRESGVRREVAGKRGGEGG